MAIIGNVHKIEKFLNDKNLEIVFAYFKQAMQKDSEVSKRIFSLPVGSFQRFDITEDVFAIEQVFYTKNRETCFIESHKKYIDFQLILSGNEVMEYVDTDKLEIDIPYDEKKDLITYQLVENTSRILLQPQDLAIYFPDDAHIGLPMYKASELVHKTVVKFPFGWWS